MAKKSKLTSVEITIPLHEVDQPYARTFKRVDASRCLVIGNRYARWLHGEQPGALLDLEGYFSHSTPHVLPDGRVVLCNSEGLVILDGDRVEARRFVFDTARHVYASTLSANGVLLTGVSEAFAVWVDLEGKQTHAVDVQDGAVRIGAGVAFALRTADGALRVTRYDGTSAQEAQVPWEATELGFSSLRSVAVGAVATRGRRLFATHHELAALAFFDDAGLRRIETSSRLHLAVAGNDFVALRTLAKPATVVVLDHSGAQRWEAPVAPFANSYAVGGFVLSIERKGENAVLFDASSGAEVFRGELPLSRADDLSEGAIVAVPGGVVVVARRHRDPLKNGWLLSSDGAPAKVAHEGVAGALAWGDDAFATWTGVAGPALSLRIWRR